ncbi:MAG: metallophosphoesterase [Legionella sp.]|nr:metallophosphoesterase [Legionella sp.]
MSLARLFLIPFLAFQLSISNAIVPTPVAQATTSKNSNNTNSSNIGKFLILSDVHLNMNSPKPTVYPNSTDPDPNADPNQNMVNNFINDAVKAANKGGPPDFVMVLGDFVAHGIPQRNAGYIKSTIQYSLQQIRTRPGMNTVPIYAALGNNDSYAGDYIVSNANNFFNDIGGIFAQYAFPTGGSSGFAANFNTNWGNYAVDIPATCDPQEPSNCKKLMMLNTIPYVSNGNLTCQGLSCPAVRQTILTFIQNQDTSSMPIIAAMHVPYASPFASDSLSPLLTESNLINKCSGPNPCVQQVWAGHVHAVNISPGLITFPSTTDSINTLLAPSVTARNNAVPGFLIVSYDRGTGKSVGIQYFSIQNYKGALAGKPTTTPIPWTPAIQ